VAAAILGSMDPTAAAAVVARVEDMEIVGAMLSAMSADAAGALLGRCLHTSTFQLNLSRFVTETTAQKVLTLS